MRPIFLLLLLLLPFAGCSDTSRGAPVLLRKLPDAAAPPLAEDFHRGVNHAHIHRRGHGYGSERSAAELDSLRRIGVNWIAITPFGFQRGAGSDHIAGYGDRPDSIRRRDPSMTDDDLIAEMASARRLGIRVALKPHIWSNDFWDGGQWHGTVNQATPEAHAAWWRSYRNMALHYARLAERGGADLYCIGTELVQMTTRYPDEWRGLIADIRREYHGKLTYAAHWDRELDSIRFWDALDFIGITAYFPLNLPDSAGVEELIAAWGPHRNRLSGIAGRWGRPVLFMEAGYRPVAGAHREPWSYSGGTYDPPSQARAYDALFLAFHDAEWWRGVYFWKTFTDDVRDYGEDRSFSFRGLPAEEVVRKWFMPR